MMDYISEVTAAFKVEVKGILNMLQQAIYYRRKIFLIGNGGSWCTAIHIAEDLNRYGINASALDSLPLVSAIANDEGYPNIFVKQLDIFAAPGDVLIALSVSGKSENIVRGVHHAKAKGLRVITLTGTGNPALELTSDIYVPFDNGSCMLVEPIHFALLHWVVYQLKPCRK